MRLNFKEKNVYTNHTMLGVFALLWMSLLSACDVKQPNQQAHQQHFVCKSLIDGFLKAENLERYELQHFQPTLHQTATERQYVYHVADDHRMKLNVPRQQTLKFQCQHDGAQRYTVQLLNADNQTQQNLISLNLPPQQTIQTLTAFALKNQ